MCKVTVPRIHERHVQKVLTFSKTNVNKKPASLLRIFCITEDNITYMKLNKELSENLHC